MQHSAQKYFLLVLRFPFRVVSREGRPFRFRAGSGRPFWVWAGSGQVRAKFVKTFRTDFGSAQGGFMRRPNRPWPRAPRFWGPSAILSHDDPMLTKNLRNCAEA